MRKATAMPMVILVMVITEDSYGYGNSYYGNYNYENISDYNDTANSDYSYYN